MFLIRFVNLGSQLHPQQIFQHVSAASQLLRDRHQELVFDLLLLVVLEYQTSPLSLGFYRHPISLVNSLFLSRRKHELQLMASLLYSAVVAFPFVFPSYFPWRVLVLAKVHRIAQRAFCVARVLRLQRV